MALSRTEWNTLLVVVLVCGSLFIAITRARPPVAGAIAPVQGAAERDPAPRAGHPAPDFSLTTLTGESLALSDLQGQVVLINVWATWCPPCGTEMPAIQAAYDQYRDQGFVVLAVNLREGQQAVAGYMHERRLTFPALLDSDGSVSAAYQARALPSSFFIDRQGIVRAVYRGPMSRGVIDGTVTQLLAEGT